MAMKNVKEDQEDQQGQKYVVLTKELQDRINDICDICRTRFVLAFDHEEDEWVYRDSKEINGIAYHYPLCYEAGVGEMKTTRP